MTVRLPDFLSDSPVGTWVDDYLEGFQYRTLRMGEDETGEVSCTLIRLRGELSPAGEDALPVLYLHGWSDYFYNPEIAWAFENAGYRFYALDLQKYGRSLREGQMPGFMRHINEYDDDFNAVMTVLRSAHPQHRPVIAGHSTGGLVAALWAHHHPGRCSAVILNSPWLELQGPAWVRAVATPVIDTFGKIAPTTTMLRPQIDFYWRSLSDEADGEWSLHPVWRPRNGFDIPRGWLAAVRDAHKEVFAGLQIPVPVLSLSAATTKFSATYQREAMQSADIIIDADTTVSRAAHLGANVTIQRFDNAMHDIFASPAPIRAQALGASVSWLDWALG